jgi:Streptomyces sporulation and cell division protein, SsgA
VTGVQVATEFTYLTLNHEPAQVRVTLSWSPDDPHAVRVVFQGNKEWFMGRELLVAGLTSETAGDGDVQFWDPEECPECVGVALDSPSGHAEFHAPRAALIDLIVRSESGFRAAVDVWSETWLAGVLA